MNWKEELIDAIGFGGSIAFPLFILLFLTDSDLKRSFFFSIGVFFVFFFMVFVLNWVVRRTGKNL